MRNYYITRNDDNNIISTFARPQYKDQEVLAEDNQEIINHFADQQAKKDTEESRINEIEAEKNTAGLKNITAQQAYDRIDQIFEGATTVATTREATITALKKMIPYILR